MHSKIEYLFLYLANINKRQRERRMEKPTDPGEDSGGKCPQKLKKGKREKGKRERGE